MEVILLYAAKICVVTFTSQGGFMVFYTPEFNKMLGEKFRIKDFPLKRKQ